MLNYRRPFVIQLIVLLVFNSGCFVGDLRQEDLNQTTAEISQVDIKKHIEFLASDELEGRMTGSEGERLATDYAAAALKHAGFSPAGDNGTYFQEFEFTAGVSASKESKLQVVIKKQNLVPELEKSWRPLAFSASGEILPAPVVFAGYGIVAPKNKDKQQDFEEYDSYLHIDVKGKWVMLLRYFPENVPAEVKKHLMRFAGLRYKAMVARDKGALGIIVVSGPKAKVKEELVPIVFDASLSGSNLAAISITNSLAQSIFKNSRKNLDQLQTKLDRGEIVLGFDLPGVKMATSIKMIEQRKRGRNVLGRLLAGAKPAEQEIIVGAHIDHLGRGEGYTSLARDEEKNQIHYGADDNASGVAGALEIAEYLGHQKEKSLLKMKRDLVVALWSGEELGTLGSGYFTNNLSTQPQITSYLNMDMIGRLNNELIIQGVGSSSIWKTEIDQDNAKIGLKIITQNDSYLPTDATPFYVKGVPILSAFTGAHEDYHTPRDTADKINYSGTEQVTKLISAITESLLSKSSVPDYLKMQEPANLGQGAFLRASLGTIPDYAADNITGVKISGVRKDGPADKAGIQGGDVIVSLAGRAVTNIYDYTFRIEMLEIGKAVPVVVKRGGKSLSLKIIPASRD